MADHSTPKFYVEENNLRYSAFSKFSEKPVEAEIRQIPPDMPAEDFFQQPGELTLHQREAYESTKRLMSIRNIKLIMFLGRRALLISTSVSKSSKAGN
jgi:hypothetical protein